MSSRPEPSVDLSVLCEHHKDSFSQIKNWEKRRDRSFFAVAALLGFLLLSVHFPKVAKDLVESGAATETATILSDLPMTILVSFVWSLLFSVVLRYCQACIWVDRQYDYLHAVEKKMGEIAGNNELFQREGEAYLNKYPAFSSWATLFYIAVYPLTVVLVSLKLLHTECKSEENEFHLYFDGLMWLGIFISFFLYRGLPAFAGKKGK